MITWIRRLHPRSPVWQRTEVPTRAVGATACPHTVLGTVGAGHQLSPQVLSRPRYIYHVAASIACGRLRVYCRMPS